ncbi:MAG: kelch domain protein, partial [Acidimicrobiales bacterium]|nr:kelch domain protein [Acidimicrobiales bacterium]
MRRLVALVTVVAAVGAWGSGVPARSAAADPSLTGAFGAPFEELGPRCVTRPDGTQVCKPAGSASIVLANGRVLYWNNLEGTENIKLNTVAEAGDAAANSQSRVLTLGPTGTPSWSVPSPSDGGAHDPPQYFLPGISGSAAQDPNHGNDGDLFCSDQVQLADGTVLATGGTNWYSEPQIPGTPYGVAELQGVKGTRIFHPDTQTWTQSGSMNFGRWYPALVTLPNGKVFVASGVTKLIKPVYPDRPFDSGTNVTQTETYDPAKGAWTDNGAAGKRSLPLFPRLHLLPN